MSKQYQNILVAVDGSKQSEEAFDRALQLAKLHDAQLLITHVIDTHALSIAGAAYSKNAFDQAETKAKSLMTQFETKAQAANFQNVQPLIEYGKPKTHIVNEVAPKKNVDLIVCGPRGVGGLERFMLGSVAEHIVRYAHCDVLISRNE